MNLEKAVALFLSHYKPTTQQAYRRPLESLRDYLGGKHDISTIQPSLLAQYVEAVIKPRNYAAATTQKHIKSIKVFFNWCVRLELIDKSPARAIHAPKPPRRISRSKAMTDAELATILDYLNHKPIPRDFALVLFLADTGCRRGGAAGLRLQDIDFDTLTATVTEKGDKERSVAFSGPCAKAIRRWLFYRSKNYVVKGEYVFSRDGSRVLPENISLLIRRACQKAGVRTLSSHSLRHRKGHQFADARVAASIAATALGHEDLMITVGYYYPTDWKSAEDALREMMTDAPDQDEPKKKSNIIPFKGAKHG